MEREHKWGTEDTKVRRKGAGTPEGPCPSSRAAPACWDPNVGLLEAACPACHGKLRLSGANPAQRRSYEEGTSLKQLKKV